MKKLASVMGVLALVAMVPLARADFDISVNGVNCASVVSPNPTGSALCSGASASGVTIAVLSLTGTQAAGFSEELGSTLLIQNNSGSTKTITIDLGISNFMSPTAPPFDVADASGLTVNPTVGKGSVSLVSCVDTSNTTTETTCSPAPGEAGPNPTLNFSGPGTTSNTTFGTITSLTPPFSLTQLITLTLSAGANLNVTSSQVLTPAPEPSALMLLGSAVMGLGLVLRRRQAKR